MSLVTALGWVALVTVFAVFSILRLVKWSLNADATNVRVNIQDEQGNVHKSPVNHVLSLYKLFLVVVFAELYWTGLAHWASGLWSTAIGLLP